MKKLILLTSMCLAGVSAFALPDYDPFADATGSGGTSYTVGANLIGQTNATGQTWVDAGTGVSGVQPTITNGSLTISGLASSGGNSLFLTPNSGGKTARMPLGTSVTSGTIYYSFALQLTSLTGISTTAGGSFFAGFNNSIATQAAAPTVIASRVYTKAAGGGYNIGIAKNSSSTSDITYSGTTYTTSDVLFIVGSYTFNPSVTDDTASMWIDPSSIDFGAGSAPVADLTTGVGINDMTTIASFLVFDRTGTPGGVVLDDLRIGTSWADVTPPVVVPEPAALAFGGFGIAALLFVRRFRRK